MVKRLRLLFAFVTSLALVSIFPLQAFAAEGPDGPRPRPNVEADDASRNLLAPISYLLSGSVWLAAQGSAPTLSVGGAGRPKSFQPTQLNLIFTAPQLPPSAPAAQGGGGLVPYRSAAPAFSRNILIPRDFSSAPIQTEPHIVVNPKDPEHLVMGTIDYNFGGNTSYVSFDGGETWEGPNQTRYIRDELGSAGDPVLAFDRQGNLHFASISLDIEEFTVGPLVAQIVVSSIAVAPSTDGGLTWGDPKVSIRSHADCDCKADPDGRVRGTLRLAFLDKPWMTVGPNKRQPEKDTIYVTVTEFAQEFQIFYFGEQPFVGLPQLFTTIRLVRSEDGGKTWSDPVQVSPTVRRQAGDVPQGGGGVGSPEGQKRVVQGSQPAVAPDGTVYAAYLDTTNDDSQEGAGEMYVARSDDGGVTFQAPVLASSFREIPFQPRTAPFRYWGSAFPQLTTGPEGEVYLLYTALPPDKPTDDGDIYLVRSLDKGKTWTSPKRLNQDTTDRLQFFPSIAVSPNGTVHAMWGDMRDDPIGIKYHIYYSRSTNKGETWGFELPEQGIRVPDTRVTDFPSNPNRGFPSGSFIGDYFSIKATDKDVYMVWADTRLGEYGGYNQKIGFARQKAIAAPQIFVSPPVGPAGKDVTIQGFNFQPDTNVFIRMGGVIVSTERTDKNGRFSARVFTPTAGKGPQDLSVADDSGNVATASFFIDFGFDTIQEVQKGLDAQVGSVQKSLTGVESEIKTLTTQVQELRKELAQQPSPGCSLPAQARAPVEGAYLLGAVGIGALLVRRRR